MAWLDDADVRAVSGVGPLLSEARSEHELRRRALAELARLVPADIMSWSATAVGAHPGPALRQAELAQLRDESSAASAYGMSFGITGRPGEAVVLSLGRREREFSERDRDVLNAVRPALETAEDLALARERLLRALATDPPPGMAVVLLDRYGEIQLSSIDAERWLAEHFGPAEHPGWLPEPVCSWLSLPPRPPLHSLRGGRALTVRLVPGEPHALLLEEEAVRFREEALDRLGLGPLEREVLSAARVHPAEATIADDLFLSPHAVRNHLERVEAKLGVRSVAEAIAAALRASA
jgi:DNA-binding CsgD family transcriptional regulator